jgi:NCS1 family nucleobase:cation symporter-1
VALVFGVIGFFVALSGLNNAGTKYEDFLLVIAYWIAPWLAVVLTDQVMRRGTDPELLLFDTKYRNLAGPVSMLVGMGVSIWLFSNQTDYVGLVPKYFPAVGDITYAVGFVLTAVLYVILRSARRTPAPAE